MKKRSLLNSSFSLEDLESRQFLSATIAEAVLDHTAPTAQSVRVAAVKPSIKITGLAHLGDSGYVQFRVTGVNLKNYRGVAVYLEVRGGIWTKPTWAKPLTLIKSDGTGKANITTGGVDKDEGKRVHLYLIPKGFQVPLAYGGSMPSSLAGLVHVSKLRT